MKWDIIERKQLVFEPGDIVCTRSKGWISRLIRKFTRGENEEPTIFNHVGIMVHKVHLAEALNRVYVNRITSYKEVKKHDVLIARRKGLTKKEKEILLNKAFDYVGRDYGYLKILGHSLDYLLMRLLKREVIFFRKLSSRDRYPICSWVVAWCYDKIGINFGVKKEVCQPDDIADDILNYNKNRYKIVFVTDGIERRIRRMQ